MNLFMGSFRNFSMDFFRKFSWDCFIKSSMQCYTNSSRVSTEISPWVVVKIPNEIISENSLSNFFQKIKSSKFFKKIAKEFLQNIFQFPEEIFQVFLKILIIFQVFIKKIDKHFQVSLKNSSGSSSRNVSSDSFEKSSTNSFKISLWISSEISPGIQS